MRMGYSWWIWYICRSGYDAEGQDDDRQEDICRKRAVHIEQAPDRQNAKKRRRQDRHACDLRAGAAMVIAAMCADGITLIEDAHFIERGYEDIVGKLTALGASIRRIETYEAPTVAEDAG